MSKVSIEFDTKTDELAVTVDGKKLENVDSVSIYGYREYGEDERKVSINISMYNEPEEDDDLRVYTSLSASVKGDIGPAPVENSVSQGLAKLLGLPE